MRSQVEFLEQKAWRQQSQHMQALHAEKNSYVFSIASGKGGVGKTTFSVNLACCLAKDYKVLLIDADISMANVHLLLKRVVSGGLKSVLNGDMSLAKAINTCDYGFDVLGGISGELAFSKLHAEQRGLLLKQFSKLDTEYDFLLLDLGAGADENVLSFMGASDEVLLVSAPEPSALSDAYALLKIFVSRMNLQASKNKAGAANLPELTCIMNLAPSIEHGKEAAGRLSRLAKKYLHCQLRHGGSILKDTLVFHGSHFREPISIVHPEAYASVSINKICQSVLKRLKNSSGLDTRMDSRVEKDFIDYELETSHHNKAATSLLAKVSAKETEPYYANNYASTSTAMFKARTKPLLDILHKETRKPAKSTGIKAFFTRLLT